MKRTILALTLMAVLLLTSSCVKQAGKYKDGTYEGASEKWQYGAENATVVIKNGKMDSITLRRLDTNGNEVNYDEWTGAEVEGKVRPNLKKARIDMANTMLNKQTYEVDAISGATVSSENWKKSVKAALDKAAAANK